MIEPDSGEPSSAINPAACGKAPIPPAPLQTADFDTTWAQNGIQRGEPALPPIGPSLFIEAGAILAKRAARGSASDADLVAIISRASEQAARLAAGATSSG